MVIRNKCEGFYNHFSSVEDRIESNEIKQLVAEKQSESGLLQLRIPVRVAIIQVQNVSVRIMRLLNTGERSLALSWTG